jgi:hypothetical protein
MAPLVTAILRGRTYLMKKAGEREFSGLIVLAQALSTLRTSLASQIVGAFRTLHGGARNLPNPDARGEVPKLSTPLMLQTCC